MWFMPEGTAPSQGGRGVKCSLGWFGRKRHNLGQPSEHDLVTWWQWMLLLVCKAVRRHHPMWIYWLLALSGQLTLKTTRSQSSKPLWCSPVLAGEWTLWMVPAASQQLWMVVAEVEASMGSADAPQKASARLLALHQNQNWGIPGEWGGHNW